MANEIALSSLPNLGAGQTSFQIGSGERFIVEVLRVDISSIASHPEQFLHWRVRAWHVNADGTPYVDPDTNHQVEIPVRMETIFTSALAEGTLTVDSELQRAQQQAGIRFMNHLAAHHAHKKIPLVP